nr:unnamed protein product [Callosobruchus chinensis]
MCTEKNERPVSEAKYRHIFRKDFKLHFHVPRKDTCTLGEPSRPGYLAGVDKKLARREERARIRAIEIENRRAKAIPSTSSMTDELFPDDSSSDCSEFAESDKNIPVMVKKSEMETSGPVMRKDLITPKVRIRTEKRKERAEAIKVDFQNDVPDVVTVQWDGKLLPALDARKSKEERLPILITHGNKEQLLVDPKLENSSGKEQAQAVWNAILSWNLEDKVQIFCCDTTSSNTGRINGACVLLEQKLERDILVFGCRHHMYELVLKSVFELKMKQVTSSPDIPLFKNFRENWNSIDPSKIECYRGKIESFLNADEIEKLADLYRSELNGVIARHDYRELIELSIIFLGGDEKKQFKVRPPGAMHQARWMAKAIYSLKMALLISQINLGDTDKAALIGVCLFIVLVYVKPWLHCILAVKAPFQELCFLKALKAYEEIDETISIVALKKFNQPLWYLTDEAAALALFDDDVDIETKSISSHGKRYVPSKEELDGSLYEKHIYDFVSIKSKMLFSRLKIDDSFLNADPNTWASNASFLHAKTIIYMLKAVNDTAERAVKLMQDFHGLITVEEEQKQFLLRCVQEHRNIYPDCKNKL